MTADDTQPHAFGLLQLRACGSRKMLACARSPPDYGGLTADEIKKTDVAPSVTEEQPK